MTTGTVIIGTTLTPYYYYKNWSGSDSPAFPTGTPYLHKWRELVSLGYYSHSEKRMIKPVFRTHVVLSYRLRRIRDQWNSYTMLGRTGTNKPASNGNKISLAYSYGQTNFWGANDQLKLLSRLSDAARGHSFNMGIALGEGSQTIALVANTVNRFTNSIKALKRGRFDLALRQLGATPNKPHHASRKSVGVFVGKDGGFESSGASNRQRLKDISDLKTGKTSELSLDDISKMWLEIQYGWKPLIGDCYESMKSLAVICDKPRKSRFSVSQSVSFQENILDPTAFSTYRTVTISRRIIAELDENLSTPRSLGLYNPAAVAWELVPFSFVADWFIPIGSYLDSLGVIPFLSGRFLTTERTRIIGKSIGFPPTYPGALTNCKSVGISRTTSVSLSVPRPEFKSWSASLSPGHLKNAVALLHVQVS